MSVECDLEATVFRRDACIGSAKVGQTEETLTSERISYEVGIAKYSELAKSMMLGDEAGTLKLLFDPQTRKLLGVHAIGQRATEIIHIGQAVMFYGGSVEQFSSSRSSTIQP